MAGAGAEGRRGSRRELIQFSAAAVAHHLRGEGADAIAVLQSISGDPHDIVSALTMLGTVATQALVVLTGVPAGPLLASLPPRAAAPLPGAAPRRAAAVTYLTGVMLGDVKQTAEGASGFGNQASAINSIFDLAESLLVALAGAEDPASVAAAISTLMASDPDSSATPGSSPA